MSEGTPAFALQTVTSTALLEGLQQPENRSVWQQFVDRYRPMIARYAQRRGLGGEDAEDVAQLTLIAFCEAYQAGKYQREQGRLRYWLFGIARNQIRNAMKKRKRREVQVEQEPDRTDFFNRVEDDESPDEAWEEEWRESVLRQCLEEIRRHTDAKSVQAFELFAWKGWPAQKVAEHLDMTPNAVFLVKHRILKRIRELMPAMEETW